ncbi:ABC transporter related [Desulfatibacillum aliphaticivorans]|uniref:ABC transporter related n=1 Tax=Desulfatibacillum aliphaticivorans TaxID=218208 RepID=B8FBG1_DESAL|nr:ABC transporter ATP-binding protein [Desulfatibacillum aliphaticivorans]ACL04605.1 ABC transporter related [Desulfatibacillum aliphaticivorans]
MLTVDKVQVCYGKSPAVQDVSLRVAPGETVLLLGRNGAGKSTLLKSIMGLEPPCSGRIIFQDRPITGSSPCKIARQGICYIPEDRQVFSNLSVLENLEMGMLAHKKKLNRHESLERVFEYFPRLKERLGQQAGSLSGGEQQMLAIARGLVSKPQLMLVDEPTEGLMPILVDETAGILRRLRQDGVTILLVEQNYSMAMSLGEDLSVYFMEKGRILKHGDVKEFQAGFDDPDHWMKM